MKTYLSRMKAKEECPPRKPIKKIFWSWIGAFLGIFLIGIIGEVQAIESQNMIFLIGSFGASAVLIYGAPLAEFSQPRNLIGGHFFSAIIGVTVFRLVGNNVTIAAPLAVSFSIVAMHFTRTLHPPGGATALIAVIGDERLHELQYRYVLTPVLLSSIVMLLVALVVNNMSSNPRRHYPVYWI